MMRGSGPISFRVNYGGLWSFSIEYDIRVVFSFLPKDRALFEDIRSHDEVY